MVVREMHEAFDTRIQLVSEKEKIERPDTFTILQFLNRAQERYTIENFLSKGSIQDNIEYIQKRSDVLRNLIRRQTNVESLTPLASTEVDGGIMLDLPTDYLHYIKSFSYATNSLVNVSAKTWTPNRVINHAELDIITNGIHNAPILRKPCVVFEEDQKVVLYKDRDTDVYNINFVYLRKPNTLSLDAISNGNPVGYTNECELDSYTHNDIVEMAVEMYIRDYKYKLTTQQAQ